MVFNFLNLFETLKGMAFLFKVIINSQESFLLWNYLLYITCGIEKVQLEFQNAHFPFSWKQAAVFFLVESFHELKDPEHLPIAENLFHSLYFIYNWLNICVGHLREISNLNETKTKPLTSYSPTYLSSCKTPWLCSSLLFVFLTCFCQKTGVIWPSLFLMPPCIITF